MTKYRPLLLLIGAMMMLSGCGQAGQPATATPGESGTPTEPPASAANTPAAVGATPAGQGGAVVVGTSSSSGPITGPPLRDMTPGVVTPGSARPVMTPGSDKTVTATRADDGRSVSIAPGDTLKLALTPGLDWTISVSDPAVLQPQGPGALVGGVGQYTARNAGKTALTGVGDPPCRKVTPPCGAPSQIFTLIIKVR